MNFEKLMIILVCCGVLKLIPINSGANVDIRLLNQINQPMTNCSHSSFFHIRLQTIEIT